MSRRAGFIDFLNGILLVDKPAEWTSHDVCAFVRKNFQIKKVGHAGTLDPLATGLLVLLLGKATKQSNLLSASEKEYEGIMEIGRATDSHDRTGTVTGTAPWEGMTLEAVREKAKEFTGDIMQMPPMVSALKHKGVRLYKLARKGKSVPREERKITVHFFRLDRMEENRIYFSVRVSKGTYVRTLVHDLGEALGCLATLAELRRVKSGSFDARDSVTIEALRGMDLQALRGRLLPMVTETAHENSKHDSVISS